MKYKKHLVFSMKLLFKKLFIVKIQTCFSSSIFKCTSKNFINDTESSLKFVIVLTCRMEHVEHWKRNGLNNWYSPSFALTLKNLLDFPVFLGFENTNAVYFFEIRIKFL